MSNTTTKHFSDFGGETITLSAIWTVPAKQAEQMFPGIKAKKAGSFDRYIGRGENGQVLPLTRVIFYKNQPSKHECNARCRAGKCGGVCECKCGGKNHGAH